jgi:hypothetical protein
MRIRQIVPALPPQHEGIGGYSLALARGLREFGIETVFACSQGGEVDFEVQRLGHLDQELPTVLHYANYGYDRHGTPDQLVSEVEKLASTLPLVTFFHEFVATGPPWRRTFWTAPTQRGLTRRIANASRVCLTTIPIYADLLARLVPGLQVSTLPMPSPAGEPQTVAPPSARPAVGVVFGGPGNREAIYRRLAASDLIAQLPVDRLVDIGPRSSITPPRVGALDVEVRGPLSEVDLSAALLQSRLGFAAYPEDFLGKSTAFAAQAAHGVPCIALTPAKFRAPDAPCLARGSDLTLGTLDATARRAADWYGGHRLETHVRAVREGVLQPS